MADLKPTRVTYQDFDVIDCPGIKRTAGIIADRFTLTLIGNVPATIKPEAVTGTVRSPIGEEKFPGTFAEPSLAPAAESDKPAAGKLEKKYEFHQHGQIKISSGGRHTVIIRKIYIDDRVQNKQVLHKLADPTDPLLIKEVSLTDVRDFWDKQGIVFGDYNVIAKDEREPYQKIEDKFYINRTLLSPGGRGGQRYSAHFLIRHCLLEMPISQTTKGFLEDIDWNYGPTVNKRKLLESFPDNIRWGGGVNAARALQQLLDKYDLVLTLTLDNSIVLHKKDITHTNFAPFKKWMHAPQDGISYRKTPAAHMVVGNHPRLEINIEDWDYVLTDDEGQVRPQTEVLKEWGLSQEYAKQQSYALSEDKSFELPAILDGAGGNETLAKSRQGILKKEAYKHLKVQGDLYEHLPLKKLWYWAQTPKFPGDQPGEFLLSGFFIVPQEGQKQTTGHQTVRYYNRTTLPLADIYPNTGRILLKTPAGFLLPFAETEIGKHINYETQEVVDARNNIKDLTAKVAKLQKEYKKHQKAWKKRQQALHAALKELSGRDAIEVTNGLRRIQKKTIGNHAQLYLEITRLLGLIKDIQKDITATIKENALKMGYATTMPVLHCSIEIKTSYYQLRFGIPSAAPALIKAPNLQVYYSVPKFVTTKRAKIVSNLPKVDAEALKLIKQELERTQPFETKIAQPILAGFHTINCDGQINQVEFKFQNDYPITQLTMNMPKANQYLAKLDEVNLKDKLIHKVLTETYFKEEYFRD